MDSLITELQSLRQYSGDIAFVTIAFFGCFVFGSVGVKIRDWDRDFGHCLVYGWGIAGLATALGFGARLIFPHYVVGCVLFAWTASLSGEVWLAFNNNLSKTVLTVFVRKKLGALLGTSDGSTTKLADKDSVRDVPSDRNDDRVGDDPKPSDP